MSDKVISGTFTGNGKVKRGEFDPLWVDGDQTTVYARKGDEVSYPEKYARVRWEQGKFVPKSAKLVKAWEAEVTAAKVAEAEAAAGFQVGTVKAAVAQQLKANPNLLVDALTELGFTVTKANPKPAAKGKKGT